MKKIFVAKMKSIIDLVEDKPFQEYQLLAIQIYQKEAITFHNAGLLSETEYRLLYELSTMVRDEIRRALRMEGSV